MKWNDQILRFTLMDKELMALDNVERGPSSPLLSLPAEVLELVLSNLNAKDLLNFLTVQPRMPARFNTKLLEISPSLDSIRLCMLAFPHAVEEIMCISMGVASEELQNLMRSTYWNKYVTGKSVKKLTTDNIAIMKGLQLSSTLNTIQIQEEFMTSPPTGTLDVIEISLPHTVTKFSLQKLSHSDGQPVKPSDFSTQGKFFFNISLLSSSLASLKMRPCPCEEFWRNVPLRFFQNVSHLSIEMEPGSYFPLSCAQNLKTFIFGGSIQDFGSTMQDVSLPSLTAFGYVGNSYESLSLISAPLFSAAPNVQCFSFTFAYMSAEDVDFLGRFVYFRGGFLNLHMNLPFILQLIPRVKCFDFCAVIRVTIEDSGALTHAEQAMLSLNDEVLKVGGRMEIVHRDPVTELGLSGNCVCRVRVFCDPSFDFDNLFKECPLLFE